MFTGDSNTKNEKIIAKRTGAIDCDVLNKVHMDKPLVHYSVTWTGGAAAWSFGDEVFLTFALIACHI